MEVNVRYQNKSELQEVETEKLSKLNKYLDDNSIVDIFVNTDKLDNYYVSMGVKNSNNSFYTHSNDIDLETAFNDALRKLVSKLHRSKDKKCSIDNTNMNDYLYEDNSNVANELDLLSATRKLNDKKSTARYNRTVQRFVDYLYLDQEIERIENQLQALYATYDYGQYAVDEKDLLLQSIEQLKSEIEYLYFEKYIFQEDKRSNDYIDETINEELNILTLKRK